MNLMIDLETLGTEAGCPVIAIGACFFDDYEVKETFYKVLNVQEQIDSGRHPSADTIKWWMQQEGAAKRVFKENALPTGAVMDDFVKFSKTYTKVKPWGNGATFDISIIESLLKDCEIAPPWLYYNVRDLRTFKEDVYDGKDMPFEGIKHHALHDAIYQANVVMEGRKRLRELRGQK